MRHKPSPATVIATVALFFALGGTAVAAHHYLVSTTGQISPSVLKKLKGNVGPAGPAGASGAAGQAGPAGPTGPVGPANLSSLIGVTGPTVEVPGGKVAGAEAVCPAGSNAVSGGGSSSIAGLDASEMESTRKSWFIIVYNESGTTLKIHAEVQCAVAGDAVAASVQRHGASRKAQARAEVAAQVQAAKR